MSGPLTLNVNVPIHSNGAVGTNGDRAPFINR